MDSERWRRIERVLDAALNVEPTEREPLLDDLCGSDRELREEVDALLRHAASDSFLDSAPNSVARAVTTAATHGEEQWVGRSVGAYHIVREIGRGGMARVFLAERSLDDFEQRVAV